MLRAQYKAQSKKVFHKFLRRSENEIISKNIFGIGSTSIESHVVYLILYSWMIQLLIMVRLLLIYSLIIFPLYTTLHPSPAESYISSSTHQFDHILPSTCSISLDEVSDGLRSLIKSRSQGPDGVSGYILANLSNSIAYSIFILYNKSLEEGVFPSFWKISSISPVFK